MKRTGRMRPTARTGNHKAKPKTAPAGPMAGGRVAGPATAGGPASPPVINVTGKPKPYGGMAMKTPTLESLSTDRGSFKIK
jgi:hypothetical protein